MNSLQHAVGFLQNAYTIVLALALTEGFKQFIDDNRERNIFWDRTWSLVGFLFMIFPFFHGMSRYLYSTYLAAGVAPAGFAGHLMFDGIAFMAMSACFFIMSRSLQPDRWKRYYCALVVLLGVDSAWIGVALWHGVQPVRTWLYLNAVLAVVLAVTYYRSREHEESRFAPAAAAVTIFLTTLASYVLMQDFYFG
jgi:hypothetical protein